MSENITWHEGQVNREERWSVTGFPGLTIWFTGLSGSGKSTIARSVEAELVRQGRLVYVLDGDNLRHGLNADLGFSAEDRAQNVRRVGEVAVLLADAGLTVLVPVISPYESDRDSVRKRHEESGLRFVEVFVDSPLDVCEERDPKGLYARARAGEITGMTGLDDPYEAPRDPDLHLMTAVDTADRSVKQVVDLVSG